MLEEQYNVAPGEEGGCADISLIPAARTHSTAAALAARPLFRHIQGNITGIGMIGSTGSDMTAPGNLFSTIVELMS